ncbi:MAG: leucyl/phenylalanyl-tRNA--protein transferase [Candidatus Nanopelagicales bacterium]
MVSERRELVGVTTTVDADMMLAGYPRGLFAMSYSSVLYQWWSPDPRGVLPLDRLRVTRSLAKSCRRHTTSIDKDFDAVLARCADTRRPGGWIDARLAQAYRTLHERGHAHSVEVWDAQGELVGGLFAVTVGGFVSGESMFHLQRDASKVALVALVERLSETGQPVVLDTQWCTPHLASLGVVEVRRRDYQRMVRNVIDSRPVL